MALCFQDMSSFSLVLSQQGYCGEQWPRDNHTELIASSSHIPSFVVPVNFSVLICERGEVFIPT